MVQISDDRPTGHSLPVIMSMHSRQGQALHTSTGHNQATEGGVNDETAGNTDTRNGGYSTLNLKNTGGAAMGGPTVMNSSCNDMH